MSESETKMREGEREKERDGSMMKEKMACCCRKVCFSRFVESFLYKNVKIHI